MPTPSIESLIFKAISLDYQHTIMAAAGGNADQARLNAMKDNWGKYLVVVDGSIPLGNPGYGTIGGVSNRDMLLETARGATAIIAVGTCAAFGGLPAAGPNPTGAVSVSDVIKDKPITNISGCPPIPVVITAVLAQYLTFAQLPELDHLFTTAATAGLSTSAASLPRASMMKGQRRAGACSSSAAKAPPPTTPARRSSGIWGRASRSSRVTVASAARSCTSGTPAASTNRSRPRARAAGRNLASRRPRARRSAPPRRSRRARLVRGPRQKRSHHESARVRVRSRLPLRHMGVHLRQRLTSCRHLPPRPHTRGVDVRSPRA